MRREPTLLVIDDDLATHQLITRALEPEGINVITAENGEQGWYALLSARPDLILLDLQMPLMTGWGFAQKMEQEGIPVPIVIMSGMIDNPQDARELGAVDFLRKPFTVETLRAIVVAHIRR